MNFYCVVYYPNIDTTNINHLRQKYDPTFTLIRPHVTVVFPVADNTVDETALTDHIQKVTEGVQTFQTRLTGLERSWDNWLFLRIKEGEGREDFVTLHDQFYGGILAPHLRTESHYSYSPHIGLGVFNQPGASYSVENPSAVTFDEERYSNAHAEAEALHLDYSSRVDRLTLIKIGFGEKGFTDIVDSKDFPLKSSS